MKKWGDKSDTDTQESAVGKLNPKQVENLIEPGTYEDGDGLRLIVKPSGRKSWLLRFQLEGRRREMGLGAYPEVSLKNSRIAANTQRAVIAAGADPLATRPAPYRPTEPFTLLSKAGNAVPQQPAHRRAHQRSKCCAPRYADGPRLRTG